MTRAEAFADGPLRLCQWEMERCTAYEGSDERGALMGYADNAIEAQLVREQEYRDFIASKSHYGEMSGFDPVWMPESLFPFQVALVEWAVRKGRAALFADCGLGKTAMQLTWASNVARHSGGRVLILTPLAVANQTLGEARKFGVDADRPDGSILPGSQVVVTNYERLHHLNASDFAGVVCDESSILKNFDGARKGQITEFMKKLPYRLLCTATAAPNDYVELGTSAEAIGEMGHMDMLSRFFRNDNNTCDTKGRGREPQRWRFKGHAEQPFWRWVCTWARAVRRPSDIGFSDDGFVLPDLIENDHVVEARTLADGMLFSLPATNLQEEREERRRTINERCERAAELVHGTGQPAVVWCHLNDEGDLLDKLIEDGEQIAGATPDERKEELFDAFGRGELRVLTIKDKIGAWGLNWQHCNHVVRFATHSFEAHYQAIRRCWRFGQAKPVTVDLVMTEGESRIAENLRAKSASADRMFAELVANMNNSLRVAGQKYEKRIEVPSWL